MIKHAIEAATRSRPRSGAFGEPRAGAVRRFLEVDIDFEVGEHVGEGVGTWAGPAAGLGSAGDGTIIEGVNRPSKSDRTGPPTRRGRRARDGPGPTTGDRPGSTSPGPCPTRPGTGPTSGAEDVDFSRDLVREWRDDRVGGLAAEVAFFGMLSLFPAPLALTSVLGVLDSVTGGDVAERAQEQVVSALNDVLSDQASGTVDAVDALFETSSPGLLTVSVVLALWAASRGFAALVRSSTSPTTCPSTVPGSACGSWRSGWRSARW